MIQQTATISPIEYVQRFDSVPEFWQYLRGLNQDDLVAELIQNELDANATHTTILFGTDSLTCQGDGDPVDEDGWERLTFVRGAGDLAPRKRNRIGIKNHGIKACFTIGDNINIRSDRKMINQTLYKNGIDQPPSPATYLNPVPDDTAPATGCLIEVPYRVKPLIINLGEPLTFDPITNTKIEEIFLRGCQEVPQRFIGALRPDIRKDYVLELRHHLLGTARFEFSCGRIRTIHRLNFYNRMCSISGEVPELPEKVAESCCLFRVPIPKDSNREIPEFYSSQGRFFLAEISWKTEGKNRPVAIHGHRRYPIEYGGTDHSAHTGLGLNFSAPYVSDLERHGAVEGDTLNECIENACKSVLVKILRLNLIPRHGAGAINLLVDPEGANEATLRNMVELMLDAGALPLLRHKPMLQRHKKRSPNKKVRTAVRFGPRKTADGKVRPIVLPMFSWEEDKISPLLAQLCPSTEDQLDQLVPSPVIKLLGDGESRGFVENHLTFEETDVIQRLQPRHEIGCFPWSNDDEWKKDLGDPSIMHRYLDVLMAVYEHNPGNNKLENLLENMYLPDTTPIATPIKKLYAGLNLPVGIPIGDIPPILNLQISSHRIFRKDGWKRPRFTFNEFLKRANLSEVNEENRLLFWQWLNKNWRLINEKPKNPWLNLVVLPIWPDKSGSLRALSALCKPSRNKLASILDESIKIPHPEILKIGLVKRAKRGVLKIRSTVSESEIMDFLDRNISTFPRDRALSGAERMRFHSWESDLAELASDRVIRSYLRNTPENAVALSKSGYIMPVGELVQINDDSIALHLAEEDMIDRKQSVLDRIDSWRPRAFPSSEQVLRALEQDLGRYEALFRRLRAYLQTAKLEHKENAKQDIISVECIPVGEKIYASGNLAFKGSRADYWGNWKHRISGQGLSADIQQVYREVGVLGTEPSPETSIEFFKWLNSQGQSTLAHHLPCVIRHINHNRGPMSWSEEFPDYPFIPVEANNNRVALVSRSAASAQRSQLFIPDFDPLVKAIKNESSNTGIRLVILGHESVSSPITQYMHQIGVKSLRDYASVPVRVHASEPQSAPIKLLQELDALRGRRMSRELRKRLDGFGLDLEKYKIRTQWRDRLLQIINLKVGTSLTATYRVGRRHYAIPTNSAFDEESGTIWLLNSCDDLDDLFYHEIAERIFENSSEFLSIILKEAIRREFREKGVYEGPVRSPDEGDEGRDGEDNGEGGYGEPGEDEPGGTGRTHGGGYPDPSKNIPDPGTIPSGITGTGKRRLSGNGGDGDKRESPRVEEIHIKDLKQKQYAWHCQICVAERTIEQLAPVNSYVEIQENRIGLIKAHHVDQVNAGGARHAGNILILCNHHHRFLGDRISRQDVIKALKETASDHTIVFKTFVHDTLIARSVSGKIATITIPLHDEKIKCFFTENHAEYWLQKAT